MFVFENKTGCRFLTVDAYLEAIPFYEKNEFRFMNVEDHDPHTRLMYYDLMNLCAQVSYVLGVKGVVGILIPY